MSRNQILLIGDSFIVRPEKRLLVLPPPPHPRPTHLPKIPRSGVALYYTWFTNFQGREFLSLITITYISPVEVASFSSLVTLIHSSRARSSFQKTSVQHTLYVPY